MLTDEGRVWRLPAASALLTVPILFLVGSANLLLTFLWWKAAIALDAVLLVGAVLAWKRASEAWLARAVAASTILATLVVAGTAVPIWKDHSRHDARLDRMADQLCSVDLPADASIDRCEGSITNTGNGNSCQYLVTATVRPGDTEVFEQALEGKGFMQTELDIYGDPMGDGKAYRRDGDLYELTLQASWEPSENDLRCT